MVVNLCQFLVNPLCYVCPRRVSPRGARACVSPLVYKLDKTTEWRVITLFVNVCSLKTDTFYVLEIGRNMRNKLK